MTSAPAKRSWHCQECGTVVEMHYDHVGPSCVNAVDRQGCSGTFQHPNTGECVYDRAELSHGDVVCKERRA